MTKDFPNRKRLRLQHFDYSSAGAYFITICTHNRKCILSNIVGAIHESPEPILTEYGKILDEIINNIPNHLNCFVDEYIIMPNHIHMIIMIPASQESRAIHESPLQSRSVISKIVGYIKMNTTKEIHKMNQDIIVWQRGYYDHVVRNRNDYEKILKYIYENPLNWFYDELYSE